MQKIRTRVGGCLVTVLADREARLIVGAFTGGLTCHEGGSVSDVLDSVMVEAVKASRWSAAG